MVTQTKKCLRRFLAFLMLAVMLCADAGVMAKAATGNAITKVAIKNIPEDGVLKLEDGSYNFDPQILAKETSKRKTTGLVYWEVKEETNTTGVHSSRWGFVYPMTAGEFEIRAVAFRNESELNQWLDARRANGYIEDSAAGEKYVTAYSDWTKITVISDTEGLGIARNQSQLNRLLKTKNVEEIKIQTNAERTFTINKKVYSTKTLIIDAPNSEINNYARFMSIEIEQIKESTFHEFAWGNRFTVKAPNARLVVEKDATVKSIAFVPEQKNTTDVLRLNIDLFGTLQAVNVAPVVSQVASAAFVLPVVTINRADANARVDDVVVSTTSEVKITGEGEKEVPVTIEEGAQETKLNADVPIKAELNANTDVTLGKEATKSEITVAKAGIVASIAGEAEEVTVKVGKSAEGAVVKAETKVEIQAEVAVKIEVGEGAEGTAVVVMGKDVKIEVENNTKEGIVIKDTLGNVVDKVVGGEKSEIVVTPTAVPTSVPSSSGGGSSSGGSTVTPSTPDVAGTPGAISFKQKADDGLWVLAKVEVSETKPTEYTGEIYVDHVENVLVSVEASTGYVAIIDQLVEVKDGIVTFEIVGSEGYKNLTVTLKVKGPLGSDRYWGMSGVMEVVTGASVTVSGTAIDVEKAIRQGNGYYEGQIWGVQLDKELVVGTNVQVAGEIKITFTAGGFASGVEPVYEIIKENVIFKWTKNNIVIPGATDSVCTVTIPLSELLEIKDNAICAILFEVSGSAKTTY